MAKRGRPPKVPTVTSTETLSQRATVSGNDARVIVNIFSPDHEPKQFSYTVKNLKGNTTHALRNPEEVMKTVISGLIRKYGA